MKQGNSPSSPVRLALFGICVLALGFVPVGGSAVEVQGTLQPNNDATLSRLSADAGQRIIAATMPNPTSYALLLLSTQQSVRITAKAQAPKATITIGGISVPNGQPSEPIPLRHGINFLNVVVTAPDGQTKREYELKVIKAYPTPNWTRVLEQAPWAPRDSSGELVFKGRMWLFGGYTPDVIGDVWSSSDGVTWEQSNDLPDNVGINIPAAFVYKDRMWLSAANGAFYSSEDGKQWTRVVERLPALGCGAVLKDRMFIVGGVEGREVWSSDNGVDWKLEQPKAPWCPRENMGNVVSHAGKLWVIGGSLGRYQPFKGYRDVWCSEDGINWTQATDQAPWPARRWACCTVYRNRIWLLGGFRGQPTWQNFNDVWYSADGKNWRQLITEDIWSPRHELSAYVHDDRLWVVAGNAWPLVNDVWQLHIPGLTFITQPVLEEYAGAQYRYDAQADFNDSAGPVFYRLVKAPEWLSINRETGVIVGTPPTAGDFPVVVEAFDEAGETARQEYSIHVVPL